MRAWAWAALALWASPAAWALPTRDQALALVFPKAQVKRQEHFLTEEQAKQATALAQAKLKSRFTVTYEAREGQSLVGVAFFDMHIVRTQPQTAMVAISPAGTLIRIE